MTALSRFLRLLPLAGLLLVSVRASDLSVVRVYPAWRDAASFKRISEYFTGRENTGGEQVIRTHPGERAGYYFLVRTRNTGAAQPAQARLSVISSLASEPRVFEFPVELRAQDTVFHLGLTGGDWNDAQANPVAWKLELLDASGRTLVTEKSYLWEKPGA